MNQTASFVITPFTNPSGEIVFRVTGWLDGKRVRKNFRTRAEADAERQVLEVQHPRGGTGIRTAITRLTDEQISEAETVFARVSGLPRPLTFYVEYALGNYSEPESQKSLAAAVNEYTAAKDHEREQDQISESHLVFMKSDLKRFLRHFPEVNVSELKGERLIAYFNFGQLKKPSLKTYNNRRRACGWFFGLRKRAHGAKSATPAPLGKSAQTSPAFGKNHRDDGKNRRVELSVTFVPPATTRSPSAIRLRSSRLASHFSTFSNYVHTTRLFRQSLLHDRLQRSPCDCHHPAARAHRP